MATQFQTYEVTYIINAVLSEPQIKDVVTRVNHYIAESGAEILETDEWGTRRLAFPIRKKRNGYYVNMYIRSRGDFIPRLERSLQIDDDILRYLTLHYDAKMQRHYEKQKQGTIARRRIDTHPEIIRKEEEEDEE